ncbi:hypothetical protein BHM03_00012765 [Ensete ventricosum]|nr:hypothetical protein BHM03_00012765 [Ensete ventricosum]
MQGAPVGPQRTPVIPWGILVSPEGKPEHFCCCISPPSSAAASAAAPSPLLLPPANVASAAAPSPSASRRPTHSHNHRWALLTLMPQPPSSPSAASSSAGHRSSSPLLNHCRPSLPSPTAATATLLQQPSPLPSLLPLLPLPRPIRDLRLQPTTPSRAASVSRCRSLSAAAANRCPSPSTTIPFLLNEGRSRTLSRCSTRTQPPSFPLAPTTGQRRLSRYLPCSQPQPPAGPRCSPAAATLTGLSLPSSFLLCQPQPSQPLFCLADPTFLQIQHHYCCSLQRRPATPAIHCRSPCRTPVASSRRPSLSSPRSPAAVSSSPPANPHLLPSATIAFAAA